MFPYCEEIGVRFGLMFFVVIAFEFLAVNAAKAEAPPGYDKCESCFHMINVAAGEFKMGATRNELPDNARGNFYYSRETPRHSVSIKRFMLSRQDVTVRDFSVFVSETGYSGKGCKILKNRAWVIDAEADWRHPGFVQTLEDPVVCVSWNDANNYARWLNRSFRATALHYRLPSEEEWEFAARAGTETSTYWGRLNAACIHANVSDMSAKPYNKTAETFACSDGFPFTSPVGAKGENQWGFYDMLGNVQQWVSNCSTDDYSSDNTFNFSACRLRGVRGTSWSGAPISVRAALRSFVPIEERSSRVGFRLAADTQ